METHNRSYMTILILLQRVNCYRISLQCNFVFTIVVLSVSHVQDFVEILFVLRIHCFHLCDCLYYFWFVCVFRAMAHT